MALKGKKLTKEHKEKIRISNKLHPERHMHWSGKKHSKETRIKMSKAKRGSRCHLWRGGLTSINKQIRNSVEYKLWRESVYERDKYTCRFCGQIGGKLCADHIKPFSSFPELRFAIDNGRTLCLECHKKTDTYLYKIKST